MLDKLIPITLVSLATIGALSYYSSSKYDALEEDQKFTQYLLQHGKDYKTLDEYKFRKSLFMEKDQMIEDYNKKITFEVGHNQFSDWTQDEMEKMTGFIETNEYQSSIDQIV